MFRITRVSRRFASSFYELFPKTFLDKRPVWSIDFLKLRKEYRSLQAQYHPDMLSSSEIGGANGGSDNGDKSSLLNKAYHTLREPLLRSQYLLQLLNGVDLRQEDVAQRITQDDPQLLMQVLEVHEQLEEVSQEEDVRAIDQANRERMKSIESELQDCFAREDYDRAAKLTVELKYWVNLGKAIKEWEPGKPVSLTH